jgi:hypothetical protein
LRVVHQVLDDVAASAAVGARPTARADRVDRARAGRDGQPHRPVRDPFAKTENHPELRMIMALKIIAGKDFLLAPRVS